jgi:hypothetical protein
MNLHLLRIVIVEQTTWAFERGLWLQVTRAASQTRLRTCWARTCKCKLKLKIDRKLTTISFEWFAHGTVVFGTILPMRDDLPRRCAVRKWTLPSVIATNHVIKHAKNAWLYCWVFQKLTFSLLSNAPSCKYWVRILRSRKRWLINRIHNLRFTLSLCWQRWACKSKTEMRII